MRLKLNFKQIAMVTRDTRYTLSFFGYFLKFKYVVKVSNDCLNGKFSPRKRYLSPEIITTLRDEI